MKCITKGIIINILSVFIVWLLSFCSLFLVLELNYIGLLLSILLLGVYIFLLSVCYKKLLSKKLFICCGIITTIFWISMFLGVNYLNSIGFWSNQFFGGFAEFLISLFAVIISIVCFTCTSLLLIIKNRKKAENH